MDNNSKDKNKTKKYKNEFEELNAVFESFEKSRDETMAKEINYTEIYRKNESLIHFNKRLIECNK
jgi:hypothetical protein